MDTLRLLIRSKLADGRRPAPKFHVECFYLWDQERRAIWKDGSV